MESIYGSPTKDIPDNAPTLKGKPTQTTMFKDANLMHDIVMGWSCTGVIHMLNQTPIDWFSK